MSHRAWFKPGAYVTVLACLGAATAVPAVATAQGATPSDEPTLAVQVDPKMPYMALNPLAADLAGKLIGAGWKVLQKVGAEDITVTISAKPSPLHTTLTITATARRDSQIVDQVSVDYRPRPRQIPRSGQLVPPETLDEAATQLIQNGRLTNFIKTLAADRARARKEEADRQAAEQQQQAEADEREWKSAAVDACKAAMAPNACDTISAYVAHQPAGAHTAEAQNILAAAAPGLAAARCRASVAAATQANQTASASHDYASAVAAWKQAKAGCGSLWTAENQKQIEIAADEDAWQVVEIDKCRHPTSPSDCQVLNAYLRAYPTGLHADEAKTVMKASAGRVLKLQKSEAAAEAAQQGREEATPIIDELCQVLAQRDDVEEADSLRRRTDARSGTSEPGEKRRLTKARIYLDDKRSKLSRKLSKMRVPFKRDRDCSSSE